MSGFEIAGVVLGAFPLFIEGLEHYRNGMETLSEMWQYREKLDDLITSFTSCIARYRLTCENLLAPMVLPDDVFAQLLEDPNSKAWRDRDLGIQIKQRLGASYPFYLRLVGRLQKALLKFAMKLGLDANNEFKPSWVEEDESLQKRSLDRFFRKSNRLWKSVMLGFDSKKIDELLAQIEKDIMRIDGLTSENIKLEVLRQTRQRKSITSYWQGVRERALRLYETLYSSWSCQCSCGQKHHAGLKLEARSARISSAVSIGIRFNVVFSNGGSSLVNKSSHTVEIVPIECTPSSSVKSIPIPSQKRKQVVFENDLPSKSPGTNLHLQNGTPKPISSSKNVHSPATRISSLCQTLGRSYQDTTCIGFLDDSPWQHYIYPTNDQKPVPSTPLSLYQTLSQSIATKEKYALALILASTLLQLHATPWLKGCKSMHDIEFYPVSSNTIGEPYINKSFTSGPGQVAPPTSESRAWVRNEAIFTLGVLLIELSYGRPLLAYKTAADLNEGKETMFTEYSVATRLAQNMAQREPPNYASVVMRCVFFTFDTPADLESAALQDRFHHDVIMPLQELNDILS